MLKIKVIADNILNLTDARYFAAFGVDYLVFDLAGIAPQAIMEIKEWVEGVKILLDVKGSLTPELLETMIKISPTGYVSSQEELLDNINDQFPDAEFFVRNGDRNLIGHRRKNQKPYIKISSTTDSIESILGSEEISGIIVEGEPEEKVGFKNFDHLDEIFDLLAV